MDFLQSEVLLSLVTLTFLEIILGIDNLIFIALVVCKLPTKIRKTARIFGLGLAFLIRIVMLMGLSWVMTLTDPLFYWLDQPYSFKNFLLIFGGLFLILKSGLEIKNDVTHGLHENKEDKKIRVKKGFAGAVIQIAVIDFIFSFDSIITAIGMTTNIPIIITAVIISMLLMLFASGHISNFLSKYPSLKIVALAFIFMVGVILMTDGFHIHISKGHLYFSLFFTLVVESLNIVARKRH